MNRTLIILEAVVDIVAIIGLVVLASLHVVSGEVVLPLITLVAGGSIGARVAKRNRLPRQHDDAEIVPGPTPDETIDHASILALALLPLLQLFLNQAVRAVAIRTFLFTFVCVAVSSCIV